MVRIYMVYHIPCVYTVYRILYISNKKQAKYKKQANKYIIIEHTTHTEREKRFQDSKKKRIKKEMQEKKLHIVCALQYCTTGWGQNGRTRSNYSQEQLIIVAKSIREGFVEKPTILILIYLPLHYTSTRYYIASTKLLYRRYISYHYCVPCMYSNIL